MFLDWRKVQHRKVIITPNILHLPPPLWLIKKGDWYKIWLIIKNLQFLSYHHETWSKWCVNEVVLLTKFHNDSSKIVDFWLVVKFLDLPVFHESASIQILCSYSKRMTLKPTILFDSWPLKYKLEIKLLL